MPQWWYLIVKVVIPWASDNGDFIVKVVTPWASDKGDIILIPLQSQSSNQNVYLDIYYTGHILYSYIQTCHGGLTFSIFKYMYTIGLDGKFSSIY